MSRLHLYAAVQIFLLQLRTVDRGCQPAPGLPCALFIRGQGDKAKLGRNKPRGCEGVSNASEVECCRGRLPITVTLRWPLLQRPSKGDGPIASRPFILRGSPRSADALRHSHLRMTE